MTDKNVHFFILLSALELGLIFLGVVLSIVPLSGDLMEAQQVSSEIHALCCKNTKPNKQNNV